MEVPKWELESHLHVQNANSATTTQRKTRKTLQTEWKWTNTVVFAENMLCTKKRSSLIGGKTMKKKKLNLFSKIKSFFVDCKVELKKIVWPSQKTVWKNTGIVLMMILVVGVFVALLDAGLMQLLSLVMSISSNM